MLHMSAAIEISSFFCTLNVLSEKCSICQCVSLYDFFLQLFTSLSICIVTILSNASCFFDNSDNLKNYCQENADNHHLNHRPPQKNIYFVWADSY